MATQTHDDGFHEIQLNGKQLVFLFMAVTVVSVVIFLCGVLVGRGVRTERAASVVDPAAIAPATIPESPHPQPPPVPAGSDPTKAAAPPSGEELTYFNELEGKKADKPSVPEKAPVSEKAQAADRNPPPARTPEPVKRPAASAPKEAVAVNTPSSTATASAAASKPAPPVAEESSTGEPAGAGFALQITALREPGEAEAIARRLSAKGYSAYVLKPAAGSPSVYRVRVGKFKTRREAETIATKLHKEEQFTPWITR